MFTGPLFEAPWWLLLLVAVAALVAGYVVLLRRRQRDVVRFTNLELLDRVAPKRPGRLRHLPIAALITALAVLTIALAGPQAEARVPRNRATVVLVIDVSLSMQATDVAPTRLAAAQAAAKDFADQLTPGVNLGLVAFAGTAAVLVSPTVEREPFRRAVDGLRLSESTATGEAIFAALNSIESFSRSIPGELEGPPPARIVLMGDGKQTVPMAPPPEVSEDLERGSFTAARAAAEAGIPVSTISFGSAYGSIDLGGTAQPVPVDDESMMQVAALSGGQFNSASTLSELTDAYREISEEIGYETKRVSTAATWTAAGTGLLLAGLAVGLVRGRRIP